MSVRWCPLLSAHSRKRRTSDKSLKQSFDVLSSSMWRISSWTFSFCGRRCFSAVSHPQQYSIATRDTAVPINIEVPMKWPQSHNDRIVVLEILSTATARCSKDQRSMATDMLWVSLEGRSRTNSPRQWFHSQLCCQIVSYFCQTLYLYCLSCFSSSDLLGAHIIFIRIFKFELSLRVSTLCLLKSY